MRGSASCGRCPRRTRARSRRLRRTAKALGDRLARGVDYAELIRALDPSEPAHAALLAESTVLLRGSGYAAFDDEVPTPARARRRRRPVRAHDRAAAAARRPLRRRGLPRVSAPARTSPDWVREALPALPEEMERRTAAPSNTRPGSSRPSRPQCSSERVGETFDAVVVELDEHDGGGTVQLTEPAVTAHCPGELPLGERVNVRLSLADVAKRQVRFELA